jgi:hypothetical protein
VAKKRYETQPYRPALPERLCPQHEALCEPIYSLDGTDYYWCPKGRAIKAFPPVPAAEKGPVA